MDEKGKKTTKLSNTQPPKRLNDPRQIVTSLDHVCR